MPSTAEQRRAAAVDTIAHSSVQPWSAGPIFPAVIAKVERYDEMPRSILMGVLVPLSNRLKTQWYELTLDGRTEQYATREDAERVAKGLLADPAARAKWNRRKLVGLVDSELIEWNFACRRSAREGL